MIQMMSNRFSRLAAVLATLAVVTAAPAIARAQDADDSGWTDDDSTAAAPDDAAPPDDPGAAEQEQVAAPSGDGQVADTDPGAATYFRPTLASYGQWVNDPTYGTVWVPDSAVVGADFAPYVTSGHWALSASGNWMWVSDYPFGWAVFHYGRWVWIDNVGWAWIAGRRYADAWVVWRVPDDGYAYVGWAPMPPTWGWYDGVAVSFWFGVPAAYVFCPSYYAFSPHVHRHIIHDRGEVQRIAHHSSRYAARGHNYRSPPPARAHVPASATPRHRTPANPRAVAASHAAATPRSHSAGRSAPYSRSAPTRLQRSRTLTGAGAGTRSHSLSGASYASPRPGRAAQASRPATARPSYARPAPAASHARPVYSRPASPSYSRPSYSRPSYSRPSYSRPSYSRPSYSRPSYSRPSYSRPSYSRPSYSRPSYSPSYSRPSYGGSSYRPASGGSSYHPSSSTSSHAGRGSRGGGHRR